MTEESIESVIESIYSLLIEGERRGTITPAQYRDLSYILEAIRERMFALAIRDLNNEEVRNKFDSDFIRKFLSIVEGLRRKQIKQQIEGRLKALHESIAQFHDGLLENFNASRWRNRHLRKPIDALEIILDDIETTLEIIAKPQELVLKASRRAKKSPFPNLWEGLIQNKDIYAFASDLIGNIAVDIPFIKSQIQSEESAKEKGEEEGDETTPEAGEEVPREGISRRQFLSRVGLGVGAVAAGAAAIESTLLKRKSDRKLADVQLRVRQQVDERLQREFEKSVRIVLYKAEQLEKEKRILVLYTIEDTSKKYGLFDVTIYLQQSSRKYQVTLTNRPNISTHQPINVHNIDTGKYGVLIEAKPKGSNLRPIRSQIHMIELK